MKDKKNTTNSNETSDSNKTSENNNNFEQLIKQQDIDLANLEKIGLFFFALWLFYFCSWCKFRYIRSFR